MSVKQFQFRFQLKTYSGTNQAVLLNYLNSKSTPYPLKDMVMIALCSFWLPLAYRDSKEFDVQQKNEIIRDCIYRLKLQSQSISSMCRKISDAISLSITPTLELKQGIFVDNQKSVNTHLLEYESYSTHQSEAESRSCLPYGELKSYQLRFQISAFANSSEAILLSYLNSKNKPYQFNDMALMALESFWLVSAYSSNAHEESREKTALIQDCLRRLELQEQYLESMIFVKVVLNNESNSEETPQIESLNMLRLGNHANSLNSSDNWDPYADS